VGIRLALDEQPRDSALQRIDFGLPSWPSVRREGRQLGDVPLYSLGKFDFNLGNRVASHVLTNVDAEIGECLGAVFGVFGGSAANPLGGEGLDYVVGLAVLKGRDLAPHFTHLYFEITEHFEELPGFRLRQERHRIRIAAPSAVTANAAISKAKAC
jgi:hypothetical protein